MEQVRIRHSAVRVVLLAALAGLIVLLWPVIASLLTQLAAGWALAMLALPLCRMLERHMKPTLAAILSFAALLAAVAALVLLALPPLVGQFRTLAAALPGLLETASSWIDRLQVWLEARGLSLTPVRGELLTAVSSRLGMLAGGLANVAGKIVKSVSKVFLAPLIAFYLLRDRKMICTRLLLLVPVAWRKRAVRAAREMKRETLGFLRGQLLLSGAVGAMTSVGLLLTGTSGWLALGVLMGVMELIPYIGPVIAGVPAVLISLGGGLMQGVWTVAVLLIVQQIEGSVLSPQLLSGATRLHPLAVLAAVSAGGMLAGAAGMLAAVPVVVSVRGMARGVRG